MAQKQPNSSDIPLNTILSFLNSIPNDETASTTSSSPKPPCLPSRNPPSHPPPPSETQGKDKPDEQQQKQQQQQQQQQQKCQHTPSFRIPLTAPHILFSPQNPNFRYLTIDHAFSRPFARSLRSELTAQFSSRLTPGDTITTTTSKNDDLATIGDDDSLLKTSLLRATLPGGKIRGDSSTFLPSSLDDIDRWRLPHLHHFSSRLAAELTRLTANDLNYFRVSHLSLQWARYPGDGASGYLRHRDAPRSSAAPPPAPRRLLTCVYYPNDEWDVPSDGGALRLHFDDVAEDIYPVMDRMIVFRSDVVEHEVMPGWKTRYALTCWVYGTLIDEEEEEEETSSETSTNRHDRPTPLPPLPSPPSSSSSRATIFVSIASYRDAQLLPTLSSLYRHALHPRRVHVGICHQLLRNGDSRLRRQIDALVRRFRASGRYEIRRLAADAEDSTGPCNARGQVQTLFRGEDYYFQIDGHLRFRGGWDEFLIASLEEGVRERRKRGRGDGDDGDDDDDDDDESRRVILTTYPPGYHISSDDTITYDEDPHPTILLPDKFDVRTGMLRQKGRRVRRRRRRTPNDDDDDDDDDAVVIIPALPLLAAGCLFAHGSFVADVPYDGTLHGLFLGEEMHLAARAYARGYDFAAPGEVFCWHLWDRGGTDDNEEEEDDADGGDKRPTSPQRRRRRRHTFWDTWNGRGRKESLERVRRLLSNDDDALRWSRGRSLETLERELGVNFADSTVAARAAPSTWGGGEYEEMEDVEGELDRFSERLVEALRLATTTPSNV